MPCFPLWLQKSILIISQNEFLSIKPVYFYGCASDDFFDFW